MYKVKLTDFEGPLELLLFFIKRDELDIYDIPISRILKEFMEYLHLIEQLDLEVAGDFIIMACTLMQIKVRMLLPKEVDESGKEIDPREELVKRLLEYIRYKELSQNFSQLESLRRKISLRHYFNEDEKSSMDDIQSMLKNITLFDLIKAYKSILENIPKITVHEVKRPAISTEEQLNYIINKLDEQNELNFLDLISGMMDKMRIIVTFIVILELCKSQYITIERSNDFNNFILKKIKND